MDDSGEYHDDKFEKKVNTKENRDGDESDDTAA